MRANLVYLLALLVLSPLTTTAWAGFAVDLDYATFRASDSLCYVEIYAAVQKSSLLKEQRGDSLYSAFSLVLLIHHDAQQILADTFSAEFMMSRDESNGAGSFFPHVFRSYQRPGHYKIAATLYQSTSTTTGDLHDQVPAEQARPSAPNESAASTIFDNRIEQQSDSLEVSIFSSATLSMSDIELGCWIAVDSSSESMFEKNSVHIIPNATLFWGERLPMAYYYVEAYGLDFDSAASDSYAVHRSVVRAEDGKKLLQSNTVRRSTGNSAVVADGFPVATLRTGAYFLDLDIQSFRSGKTVTRRKKFWTFRDGDFAAGRTPSLDPELQSRLWASAPNIVELIAPDSALNLMRYLLTTDEQAQLDLLNSEGKRRYLRDYWANQESSDPGSANRYFARIAEANSRYKILHRSGWRTDRGRVFALYGEPDQVERSYMPSGSYNSEVWHYDRFEGGVIFAFVDYNEYGDMELVHSTKRGEIYNPNWERQVTGRRHQLPTNSNIFEGDR